MGFDNNPGVTEGTGIDRSGVDYTEKQNKRVEKVLETTTGAWFLRFKKDSDGNVYSRLKSPKGATAQSFFYIVEAPDGNKRFFMLEKSREQTPFAELGINVADGNQYNFDTLGKRVCDLPFQEFDQKLGIKSFYPGVIEPSSGNELTCEPLKNAEVFVFDFNNLGVLKKFEEILTEATGRIDLSLQDRLDDGWRKVN